MTTRPVRNTLLVTAIAAVALSPQHAALAAEYTLMPSPQTVHIGYFSAALKPVLTINSGDNVTIETMTHTQAEDIERSGVVPPSAVPDYVRAIYRDVKDRGPSVHILTGPVFVNGAEPGDVLEVRIETIDLAVRLRHQHPAPVYGRTAGGVSGLLPAHHPIDRDKKTAEVAPGVVVPARPFFGTMGVAPLPSMGRISSGPPGIHTGNLDNKDLDRRLDALHADLCAGRAVLGRRRPRRARATARSILPRSKPGCAAASSLSSART